jgi:catechol 2,3-dioxygenase-like lactoylglutathione lyase family enzyme
MRVRRVGYVGMRAKDVDGMTAFLRNVLGLEPGGEQDAMTFQKLPTNRLDLVEVYSEDLHDVRMIPDEADLVVGFVVDDIRAAMVEAEAAGLEFVNEPVWATGTFDEPRADDWAWFWLRAPDGRIYVIEQVPD